MTRARALADLANSGVFSPNAGLSRVGINSTSPSVTLDVGGGASFAGNVSVGGTLTYDDVTNIDSVGIITAQSGIHVTGGSVGIGTNNPVGNLEVRDSKANLIVAKDGLTVKSNSEIATQYDLIQLGAGGALASYSTATATADTQLVHNAYRHSGGTQKYRYADTATRIMMNTPGGAFRFQNAASGSADADITFTERLRIDANGHMGLGVTPSAWATNGDFTGLQVKGASLFGRGSGDEDRGGIAVNYYHTGSAEKYIANGNAARIYLADGNIHFSNAAANSSGAGAAMTLTERLRIDSAGNVGINETTPDSKVDIVYHTSENSATANLIHLRADPGGSYVTRGLFVKVGRDGAYDNSAVHYDIVGSSGNSGFHAFEVQGNEKLRITKDGDMGLGNAGCSNPGADPNLGNDATVFEIRQTTTGLLNAGNNRKGAVLRLKHEGQWENGYQNSATDDLGRVEFVTGDSSTGEGVRSVIRCRNLQYYNNQALTFELGNSNSATITERLRITSDGNIGIGNDSPNCILAVKDVSEFGAYVGVTPSVGNCMLQLYNNPPNETANDHSTIQFGVNGGTHNRVNTISAIAESASNRKMATTFCTDDGGNRTEKMRITGAGQMILGIATNLGSVPPKFTIVNNTNSSTFSECQLLRLNGPSGVGERGGIGFHYAQSLDHGEKPSSFIGVETVAAGGAQQTDLLFATRPDTTDSEPSERLRITSAGIIRTPNLQGNNYREIHRKISGFQSGSSVVNYLIICQTDRTNVRLAGRLFTARASGTSACTAQIFDITFQQNHNATERSGAIMGLHAGAPSNYGHAEAEFVSLTYNSTNYYAIRFSSGWVTDFDTCSFDGIREHLGTELFTHIDSTNDTITNVSVLNADGDKGDVTIQQADLRMSDGDIIMPSGHGINFHNYGAGSNIRSNLLDDYEEGKWVPVITSNGTNPTYTYSNNYSHYIKIGRLVHFNVDLYPNISNVGSGGAIYVSTPFPVDTSTSNSMEHYVGGIGGRAQTTLNLSRQEIGWYHYGSVMYMMHQNKDTFNESGTISTSDLRTGSTRLNFCGTYYAAT